MSVFFYDSEENWQIVQEGKVKRKIKAYSDELMMVEVFFEDNAVGEAHKHVHVQATYCLEGEFEFTVGDEVKCIKEGDTLLIPSDIVHGCKLLTAQGRLLDVFTPCRQDFLNN